MRTQILKGLGAMTLMAVLAGVSTPVDAATIKASVPFSFNVNQKALPPGTYTVDSGIANGLIVRGYSSGAVTTSMRLESSKVVSPKLVFHRYGEEYILREVWTSAGSGFGLPKTRRERELASGRNGKALARFERVEIPVL
jgi:hypothetical protein